MCSKCRTKLACLFGCRQTTAPQIPTDHLEGGNAQALLYSSAESLARTALLAELPVRAEVSRFPAVAPAKTPPVIEDLCRKSEGSVKLCDTLFDEKDWEVLPFEQAEWEERYPLGGRLLLTQLVLAAVEDEQLDWCIGRLFCGEGGLRFEEGSDSAVWWGVADCFEIDFLGWADVVTLEASFGDDFPEKSAFDSMDLTGCMWDVSISIRRNSDMPHSAPLPFSRMRFQLNSRVAHVLSHLWGKSRTGSCEDEPAHLSLSPHKMYEEKKNIIDSQDAPFSPKRSVHRRVSFRPDTTGEMVSYVPPSTQKGSASEDGEAKRVADKLPSEAVAPHIRPNLSFASFDCGGTPVQSPSRSSVSFYDQVASKSFLMATETLAPASGPNRKADFQTRLPELTSLDSIRAALAPVYWPVNALFAKQFKAKRISVGPWTRSKKQDGTLLRRLQCDISTPKEVPASLRSVLVLPKQIRATFVFRYVNQGDTLVMVQQCCLHEVRFSEYVRFQDILVFKCHPQGSVVFEKYADVIWTNTRLPLVLLPLKNFVESKYRTFSMISGERLGKMLSREDGAAMEG
eukprot:TRINITY_DN24082_c0_g1_i1.p1 TRINITY_DN24082_c0_g1~~TRINITY_DN24082_c0_g1_i1.p1  ORF type:complete len:570 (+),score=75.38 TRINITY_DN24082_c0_g1_i1:157-1866(+)